MKTISIISTVYYRGKAEYLEECLSSVFSQTVMPNKMVLVGDGKLTDELYEVIKKYKSKYGDTFLYKETDENIGNWNASNIAISLCETDIVAKIDSDDYLLPEYTKKVLDSFNDNDIDILGVYIDEFDNDTKESLSIKKTPVSNEDIYSYAKRRNPFNNPGIAFLKKSAEKIGMYNKMERCEDYDFVVRMLIAGAKGMNIPEVLVKYRTNADNIKRRKNYTNTKWFIKVRWNIHKMGFSSMSDFLITFVAQIGLFVMPVAITEKFYKKMRSKDN